MFIIRIGTRYFSARRGYFGGLVSMEEATRFSLADATDRASRTAGATIRPCPEYAAQCLDALQSNQVA
jgi:hypothetical protein